MVDAADGRTKLAGINSLVDGNFSYTQAGPFFPGAIFDARGFWVGDESGSSLIATTEPDPVPAGSYATRVSSRMAFITGIIGIAPNLRLGGLQRRRGRRHRRRHRSLLRSLASPATAAIPAAPPTSTATETSALTPISKHSSECSPAATAEHRPAAEQPPSGYHATPLFAAERPPTVAPSGSSGKQSSQVNPLLRSSASCKPSRTPSATRWLRRTRGREHRGQCRGGRTRNGYNDSTSPSAPFRYATTQAPVLAMPNKATSGQIGTSMKCEPLLHSYSPSRR